MPCPRTTHRQSSQSIKLMAGLFKHLALFAFFALMINMVCWITLADHSDTYPTAAWLIIALVPLLFPLKGLLHGLAYTYAWTTFLMLFYFTHGIGELYSAPDINPYAVLEIVLSLIVFISAVIFIRLNAKTGKKEQNDKSAHDLQL